MQHEQGLIAILDALGAATYSEEKIDQLPEIKGVGLNPAPNVKHGRSVSMLNRSQRSPSMIPSSSSIEPKERVH